MVKWRLPVVYSVFDQVLAMQRELSKLAAQEYDVLIVGGGIFGACAAWDAVLRGYSVALIERADFASGASTVSPIFHTLDTFRGTLIFDEADFRFSDEKSQLVKIFNNGNVRGFPVLRTMISASRVFNPRAFNVFGPKIVAMRKAFDDPALERWV